MVIPARREPVESVHLNGTHILLQYRSGDARVYESATGELQQTLLGESTKETLGQPGWLTPYVRPHVTPLQPCDCPN